MLSKTFATLSVLALGLLSVASPTETPAGDTSIQVIAAVSNSTPHPDISHPDYNAIITCPQQNCGGSCQTTPLSSFKQNVCKALRPYRSIEIWHVTPGRLPHAIFAALQGCTKSESLPYTDTCYNVLLNEESYPFGAVYIN